MNDIQVPVWEKYAMTVEEASQYFSVGQNKIRQLDARIKTVPVKWKN